MKRFVYNSVVTDGTVTGRVYIVHPNGEYSLQLEDTTAVRMHDQLTLVEGELAEYDFQEQIRLKEQAIVRAQEAQKFAVTKSGEVVWDGLIKKYRQDIAELEKYQKVVKKEKVKHE